MIVPPLFVVISFVTSYTVKISHFSCNVNSYIYFFIFHLLLCPAKRAGCRTLNLPRRKDSRTAPKEPVPYTQGTGSMPLLSILCRKHLFKKYFWLTSPVRIPVSWQNIRSALSTHKRRSWESSAFQSWERHPPTAPPGCRSQNSAR